MGNRIRSESRDNFSDDIKTDKRLDTHCQTRQAYKRERQLGISVRIGRRAKHSGVKCRAKTGNKDAKQGLAVLV